MQNKLLERNGFPHDNLRLKTFIKIEEIIKQKVMMFFFYFLKIKNQPNPSLHGKPFKFSKHFLYVENK